MISKVEAAVEAGVVAEVKVPEREDGIVMTASAAQVEAVRHGDVLILLLNATPEGITIPALNYVALLVLVTELTIRVRGRNLDHNQIRVQGPIPHSLHPLGRSRHVTHIQPFEALRSLLLLLHRHPLLLTNHINLHTMEASSITQFLLPRRAITVPGHHLLHRFQPETSPLTSIWTLEWPCQAILPFFRHKESNTIHSLARVNTCLQGHITRRHGEGEEGTNLVAGAAGDKMLCIVYCTISTLNIEDNDTIITHCVFSSSVFLLASFCPVLGILGEG